MKSHKYNKKEMNMTQSVKFCRNSDGKCLELTGFKIKCKLIVDLIVSYCYVYLDNNNNNINVETKEMVDNCILSLQKTSFIDISKLKKIENFRKMESSGLVTIKLNQLHGLSNDPPPWLFHSGLIGLWWIIQSRPGTTIFSDGHVFDIVKSLVLIHGIVKTNSKYAWIKDLSNFFMKAANDVKVGMNNVVRVKNC